MIIYILAAVGLIGIIVGFWSISYLKNFFNTEYATPNLKKLRSGVVVFAIIIGLLTWPGTFFMGYPLTSETETGRVVGIPFIVAYFDSQGHDYVGPFTILGVIANSFFWFLLPHIVLAAYIKRIKINKNA